MVNHILTQYYHEHVHKPQLQKCTKKFHSTTMVFWTCTMVFWKMNWCMNWYHGICKSNIVILCDAITVP